MEKLPQIEKIYEDIKSLKIQGATNVCIATFEGMRMYLKLTKEVDYKSLLGNFFELGLSLAQARENEPLAVNGIKFLKYKLEEKLSLVKEVGTLRRVLDDLCEEYLDIISESKKQILKYGKKEVLKGVNILTHCHSSTAVGLIKILAKEEQKLQVVSTETRPLMQGRKTSQSLLSSGIDTTMITDSAVESFIIGRGSIEIGVVLIGCDEILSDGSAVNKIGSWGIGMACHYARKPLYVVTPSLKFDYKSTIKNNVIEVREDREVWNEAPSKLKIYNPAFEVVDKELITGYVTELGVVSPNDIFDVVKKNYPWIIFNL